MGAPVAIAGTVLVVLVIAACLVGSCFDSRKTPEGIMIGAIAAYLLVVGRYFRFIAFVFNELSCNTGWAHRVWEGCR